MPAGSPLVRFWGCGGMGGSRRRIRRDAGRNFGGMGTAASSHREFVVAAMKFTIY
ncbi:hypothetical protein [Azospirillum palustre]